MDTSVDAARWMLFKFRKQEKRRRYVRVLIRVVSIAIESCTNLVASKARSIEWEIRRSLMGH